MSAEGQSQRSSASSTSTEAVRPESESEDVKSEGEEEEEAFVTKILKKQFVDGKPEYLVKWTYCVEDTWEPMENLTNCTQLVEEFEEKWKRSKAMQRRTEKLTGIEKIVDMRIQDGKKEYLVKWVACSQKSWEPSETVKNKPELVRAFEKEQQQKQVGVGGPATKDQAKNSKKAPVNSGVKKGAQDQMSANAKKGRVGTRSNTGKKRKVQADPVSRSATKKVLARSFLVARSLPPATSGTRSSAKKRKLPDPVSGSANRKKKVASSTCVKTPSAPIPVCSLSSSDDDDDEPEIEKIVNATDAGTEGNLDLQYLVKYKGENRLRRVPAGQIHAKSPQVALAFYVERRAWEVPI